jgi:hypothetical protein
MNPQILYISAAQRHADALRESLRNPLPRLEEPVQVERRRPRPRFLRIALARF